MCKAKIDGGRRCPCSGGVRPTPKGKAEKKALAAQVRDRRERNAVAARAYRDAQDRQEFEAFQWVQGKSRAQVLDRLLRIEGERGRAAERKVLAGALQRGSGLRLAG